MTLRPGYRESAPKEDCIVQALPGGNDGEELWIDKYSLSSWVVVPDDRLPSRVSIEASESFVKKRYENPTKEASEK